MALRGAFVGALLFAVAVPATAQEKQPPYWASIASGLALTHTGPGRTYPNVWLYQRRDLPVRVVKKYETWRMIQDPDGAQGWMLVTMLSDRRTAIVKPGEPRAIRSDPSDNATVRYRAEQGVVGRISKCKGDGWCRIEIGKKDGYVRTSDLWGVGDTEVVD
jgi:SH3-like domain-containing protein